MAQYECTFIARQDLSKADVDKLADNLTEILQKHKGSVVKREYWGLRSLAYEVKQNRRGHYIMLGVAANNEAMEAFRTELRLNEDIIRNLEIKVEKLDSKPSVIASRDEAA